MAEKLLYFYPPLTPTAAQLDHMQFCEALLAFSRYVHAATIDAAQWCTLVPSCSPRVPCVHCTLLWWCSGAGRSTFTDEPTTCVRQGLVRHVFLQPEPGLWLVLVRTPGAWCTLP